MDIHERFGNIPEIDLGEPLESNAERRARQKRILKRARQIAVRRKAFTPPPPRKVDLTPWLVAGLMVLMVLGGIFLTAPAPVITVGW